MKQTGGAPGAYSKRAALGGTMYSREYIYEIRAVRGVFCRGGAL